MNIVLNENEILFKEINEDQNLNLSNQKFFDYDVVLGNYYILNQNNYDNIEDQLYQGVLYRGYLLSFGKYYGFQHDEFYEKEFKLLNLNS